MEKQIASYKIHNPDGYFMGAAVFQEDAANWASTLGEGATVRRNGKVLYTIPEYGEEVDFLFDTPPNEKSQ